MRFLIPLASAMLFFIAFAYTLEFVAFDEEFYFSQYEKNNVPFDKAILNNVTKDLQNYLRYETIDPIANNFFNEKEKTHLVDVRRIIRRLHSFTIVLTFCLVFILLLLIPQFKRHKHPYRKVLALTGTVGIGILVLLGMVIAINFNVAFVLFHKMIFTNDLWMLNSAVDKLIVLVPEQFFIAISLRWALLMGFTYGLMVSVSLLISKSL